MSQNQNGISSCFSIKTQVKISSIELVPGRRHILHAVPAALGVPEYVRLAEVILSVENGRMKTFLVIRA